MTNNTSFAPPHPASHWHLGRCDFTDVESKFDALIYIFIALIALVQNVIIAMCYYRYRSLKTITNLCLLSSTASDLLVSVFSIPFTFGVYLCQLRPPSIDKRSIGDFIYLFCDMLPSILSIYSLCLVAIDRLMAVTKPYVHQRHVTKQKAIIAIAVMWLSVIFMVSLILVLERQQFTLFIVFMSYIFPVTLMIVAYSVIGFVAMRHAKAITKWEETGTRLKKNSRAFTFSGDMHPSSEGKISVTSASSEGRKLSTVKTGRRPKVSRVSADNTGHLITVVELTEEREDREAFIAPISPPPNNLWREIKSTVRLLILLTVFIIAWTPFMTLNIQFYVCQGKCWIDGRLLKYFKMLHYSNSALNPMLYVLLSKRWRAALLMMVCHPKASSRVSEMTLTSSRDW